MEVAGLAECAQSQFRARRREPGSSNDIEALIEVSRALDVWVTLPSMLQ
jgi:hypothetical protein